MPDVSRVPAPDPADTLDFFIAAPISEHDAVATQKARAALDALLAGRRQDKERIEQLEKALAWIGEFAAANNKHGIVHTGFTHIERKVRAALADKEDTTP